MVNFKLTYAAFLFPAIPLMMLTFGNRWIAISKLIRQMHSDFLDKKKNRSESADKYLTQIKILSLKDHLMLLIEIKNKKQNIFFGELI